MRCRIVDSSLETASDVEEEEEERRDDEDLEDEDDERTEEDEERADEDLALEDDEIPGRRPAFSFAAFIRSSMLIAARSAERRATVRDRVASVFPRRACVAIRIA